MEFGNNQTLGLKTFSMKIQLFGSKNQKDPSSS